MKIFFHTAFFRLNIIDFETLSTMNLSFKDVTEITFSSFFQISNMILENFLCES